MVSRRFVQAGILVSAVLVASACQNTREGLEKDAEQAAPKVERAAERSAQAAREAGREVAAAAAPAAQAIKEGAAAAGQVLSLRRREYQEGCQRDGAGTNRRMLSRLRVGFSRWCLRRALRKSVTRERNPTLPRTNV